MKTILHIITDGKIGGTETFLKEFLYHTNKYYPKKKVNFVHKVLVLKRGGIISDELAESGIEVIILNSSNIIKLINTIKRIQPDIIQTYLYRANILGRIAGLITKIPVISTQRSIDNWRRPIHNLADYFTSLWTKKIVVNSQTVKTVLHNKTNISNKKIKVIYPGIDKIESMDYHFEQSRQILLGYLGRLSPEKDIFTLLKAFGKMSKENHIKLYIAGAGIEKIKIDKYIQKNQLQDKVIFLGWVRNLKSFFEKINLLVQPSTEEGFSRAILESMLYGVPVVASDIQPNIEALGEKGMFFMTGNVDDLIFKIKMLTEDNVIRNRYINYLEHRVTKEFSLARCLDEWYEMYIECLNVESPSI